MNWRGDRRAIAVAAADHETMFERPRVARGEDLTHFFQHALDIGAHKFRLQRNFAQT